jgi:hypothetical protein
MRRWAARTAGVEGRTRHLVGATPMPPAVLAVIEERPDGVFILRWAADGSFAGDTWHMDRASAHAQADVEYSLAAEGWRELPGDVTSVDDILEFLRHD